MNKTIKIIDLLNKIANGEVVPKTILFWDKEYKFDDEYKCYMHKISEDIFDDFMDNNNDELDEFLNDTVEIIEDNDKLEKIEITGEQIKTFYDGDTHFVGTNTKDRHFYIPILNKIIDHINKIEEKLDDN